MVARPFQRLELYRLTGGNIIQNLLHEDHADVDVFGEIREKFGDEVVDGIAREHLAEVERKIADLSALRQELVQSPARWSYSTDAVVASVLSA